MSKCSLCNVGNGVLYPVDKTCVAHIPLMINILKLMCGPELYQMLYGE